MEPAGPADISRVAIIDDDAALRSLMCEMLQSQELATLPFASVIAFLEQADVSSVACVVSDIQMPGTSGIEFQQWLASHYPQLPVILVTGSPAAAEEALAVAGGAFDVITKPFLSKTLTDRVTAALAWRVAANSHQASPSLARS